MPSIESENCGRSQSRNSVRKISSKITKKKPKTCPAIPTNAWSVSGTLPAMSEACTCAWLPMSNCSSSRWNASESRISATICGSAWMRSRNSRNSGIARASVISTPTTTRPRTVSVAARAAAHAGAPRERGHRWVEHQRREHRDEDHEDRAGRRDHGPSDDERGAEDEQAADREGNRDLTPAVHRRLSHRRIRRHPSARRSSCARRARRSRERSARPTCPIR